MTVSFRYEAICCPFRSCTALRRVRRIIIICWFCSLIIAIPQLFIFEQSSLPMNSKKFRCASTGYTSEWQRRVYFTMFACYVLIIPAFCMTICYVKIICVVSSSSKTWTTTTRYRTNKNSLLSASATSPSKIKTVKLAMTIIIVFVACWTPYIVLTLSEIYSNGRMKIPSWFDGVLQTICLFQSGLNPLIYITFNHRRKDSSTIVLTSLRVNSRRSRLNTNRAGSTSSCSVAQTSFQGHPNRDPMIDDVD